MSDRSFVISRGRRRRLAESVSPYTFFAVTGVGHFRPDDNDDPHLQEEDHFKGSGRVMEEKIGRSYSAK